MINPKSQPERLASFLTPLLLLLLLFQGSLAGFTGVSVTTGTGERAAPLGVSPSVSAHGGPRRCGAQMMITALRCMLRTSLPLPERQRRTLPTKSLHSLSLCLSLVFPLSLPLSLSRCLFLSFSHFFVISLGRSVTFSLPPAPTLPLNPRPPIPPVQCNSWHFTHENDTVS